MLPLREQTLRTIGRLVRQCRNARGLSQEALAERSGLDRTYVSGVERGIRNPSATALMRLAYGLNTTVSALLDGLEKEVYAVDEPTIFPN